MNKDLKERILKLIASLRQSVDMNDIEYAFKELDDLEDLINKVFDNE